MKLIIILLVLIFRRLEWVALWRWNDRFLASYLINTDAFFSRIGCPPVVRLALVLLLPTTVLLGFLMCLSGVFFNIWLLLLNLAILIYVIGHVRILDVLDRYLAADAAGNKDGAESVIEDAFSISPDKEHYYDEITTHALKRMRGGFFSVVFWFFVLGGAGAVLYRLLWRAKRLCTEKGNDGFSELSDVVSKLFMLAEFLPARGMVMGFMLMGNFSLVFGPLLESLKSPFMSQDDLVKDAALVSINIKVDELQAADKERGVAMISQLNHLLFRTMAIWLVLLALLVISP